MVSSATQRHSRTSLSVSKCHTYAFLPAILSTPLHCARAHTHTHTHTFVGFIFYTGRFIMFSVITNIYNKKTKGPTLMELFTARGKLNFFFVRCVPCHPWCTHRTSLVVKKKIFSFPVAVNNSVKVGPLVFLL